MDWSVILFFLGIALVVTFLMQREIKRVIYLREFGIRTQGKVTGHKVRIRRSSTIYPIIHYTTQQGEELEVIGKIGAAIPWRKKGQYVTVLYDEQEPQSFVLEDETEETGPYFGIIVAWLIVLTTLVIKWQTA